MCIYRVKGYQTKRGVIIVSSHSSHCTSVRSAACTVNLALWTREHGGKRNKRKWNAVSRDDALDCMISVTLSRWKLVWTMLIQLAPHSKHFRLRYKTSLLMLYMEIMIRDSSIGIVTCYGLVVPGIESWLCRDFLPSSRLALGPTLPPIQWVPRLFPEGKATEAWRLPLIFT